MTHFIKEIPAGDTKLRDVCNRCGFINYQNPRVVLGALAVTNDERVHLVERDGEWTLPYDFMKVGETSKEGARRLIAATQSDVDHILTLDDMPDAGLVLMTFRARVDGITEGALFSFDEAREKLTANPAALHALAVYDRAKGRPRFSPGILCHSFNAATLHVPPEACAAPAKPCGDCSFDKGGVVKIVSGVVPVHDDKILLAKRAIQPRIGFWTLPAGFMELGETLREGARREADEETGAAVDVGELLVIYEIPKIGQVMTIFRGTMPTPDVAPGIESQDARLFSWTDIPWDELAFPMVHAALNKHDRYKTEATVSPCHMLLTPVAPGEPPKPGIIL